MPKGSTNLNSLKKENNMFYADMAIDAVQNAKKTWLNSVVSNDDIKNPLNAC